MLITQVLKTILPGEPWYDLVDLCHGEALIPDELTQGVFELLDAMANDNQ